MVKKALIGLGLLVSTAAVAATPHQDWVRARLESLPASRFDRAEPSKLALRSQQLDAFASEIAKVSARAPLPPRQWSALIITQGGIESNFDTSVVLGNCPRFFCDMVLVKGVEVYRARGAFQNHDVAPVHDLWVVADGDPKTQVQMADRMLRRSMTGCAAFAPFPQHVFRAYRGGFCGVPAPREAERVALYQRLVGR